jgi:PTS system ascorbate-specific IIC component
MFLCPLFGLSVIVPGWFLIFLRGNGWRLRQHYWRTSRGSGGGICPRSAHFVPAILLPMMGDMGLGSTTFGDADFGVVGIVLGHIIAMFN